MQTEKMGGGGLTQTPSVNSRGVGPPSPSSKDRVVGPPKPIVKGSGTQSYLEKHQCPLQEKAKTQNLKVVSWKGLRQ